MPQSKRCPYCDEKIRASAVVCRHCLRPLPGHETDVPQPVAGQSRVQVFGPKNWRALIGGALVVILAAVTVVAVLLLRSCPGSPGPESTESADTDQAAQSEPWAWYVTGIREDSQKPRDGWKRVIMDIVIENTSGHWAPLPNGLTGTLIDSGGYQRGLTVGGCTDEYSPQGNLPEPSGDLAIMVPPSFRLSWRGTAELPAVYDPVSVRLSLIGQEIQLANLSAPLAMPFDQLPTDLEIANVGYTFDFPNVRRVTFRQVEFVGESDLDTAPYDDFNWMLQPQSFLLTLEIQNLGGFDIEPNAYYSVYVASIDNLGRCRIDGYTEVDLSSRMGFAPAMWDFNGSALAPGQTGAGVLRLRLKQPEGIDTVWLILAVAPQEPANIGPMVRKEIGRFTEWALFRIDRP